MIRRLRWRYVAIFALLGAVVLLTGCDGGAPQSTIRQAGANNRRIWDVYNLLWIGAAIVGVLVEGLLVFAIFKFRHAPRTAHGRPVPVHGNTKLEVAWTIVPAIVLVIIGIPTMQIIAELYKRPDPAQNPLQVTVVARQFYFEFIYPELGISSVGEMDIPAGRPIDIRLESADVIHSFWIPSLAGKRDNIPGRATNMWLTADKPGEYPGQCAEYCGIGHANMRMKVVARTEADFNAWVAQKKNPSAVADPAAGQALFLSGQCAACHKIAGTTANGSFGPELTNIASRPQIAGTLENTPENLAKWLDNPPAVKPGTQMPDLPLSQSDISNLVAFLETLK